MNKEMEQVPMKEGSITEQLNLLGELIEELTNQIGFLEERFKDVLFPVMQEEEAVQKEPQKSCDPTIALKTRNKRIRECIYRINLLVNQCEL